MPNDKLSLDVQWIEIPQKTDERGALSVMDAVSSLPFCIQRVFWITDVPAGQTRGGHAHRTCHEVVFAASGSFELEIDDGRRTSVVQVQRPCVGVLIPAGVWCQLRNFAPGTVCLVAASEPYDSTGYVHDYAEWKEELKKDPRTAR